MEKTNTSMVLFDRAVIEELLAVAKTEGATKEVGGVLLGYRKDKHLHVTKATYPGRKDVSQRYRFIRQDISHQLIALRNWLKSGKKIGWLGEWHTHPESCPSPSSVDLSSWKDTMSYNKIQMTFMIIGTQGLWVGLMQPTYHLQALKSHEDSERGILFA